jgi:hypothetical protein
MSDYTGLTEWYNQWCAEHPRISDKQTIPVLEILADFRASISVNRDALRAAIRLDEAEWCYAMWKRNREYDYETPMKEHIAELRALDREPSMPILTDKGMLAVEWVRKRVGSQAATDLRTELYNGRIIEPSYNENAIRLEEHERACPNCRLNNCARGKELRAQPAAPTPAERFGPWRWAEKLPVDDKCGYCGSPIGHSVAGEYCTNKECGYIDGHYRERIIDAQPPAPDPSDAPEFIGNSSLLRRPESLTEVLPEPREWLCSGGGGHESGADDLRAMTVSGEGLVEFLEAYRDAIMPLLERKLR